MKTLRYARHGQPEEVLDILDLPPGTPKDGEVLLDIEAVSIWPHDLYSMQGLKGFEEVLPHIPGNKCVGIVRAAGRDAGNFQPGDRVNVGYYAPGTWRQQVCVGVENLLPIPHGVDAGQYSLMGNMLTSYYALEDLVPLKPGDWIIQNGANSSCGQFIIQLAKQRGLHTVNVVRREEERPYLRQIGADVVVVDGPDLVGDVAADTGNAKIILAIDMVAGHATERLAGCLAQGGTIACYGLMSSESCQIAVRDLLFRDIRLIGYYMGKSRRERSREEFARAHDEVAGLVADGILHARIAANYDLDHVRDAVIHQAREASARPGKIILRPNGMAVATSRT
jgi:trans-2-enoyl-CoA reductase